MQRQRAFTMIELMVVVALAALVLALAAPSFRDFILLQRLKGISAQVVTDLQFARSEAASRGVPVRVAVQPLSGTTLSCYIIYSDLARPPAPPSQCDCKEAEGARCTDANTREIRTVQVPSSLSVYIATPFGQARNFSFDPRNGAMTSGPVDVPPPHPEEFAIDATIDAARSLRSLVGASGRVKACVPPGSTLNGDACPW